MNYTFHFEGDEVLTLTRKCCDNPRCYDCQGAGQRIYRRKANAYRADRFRLHRAMRFLEIDEDAGMVSVQRFVRRANAFLEQHANAWAKELYEPLLEVAHAARRAKAKTLRWDRGWL
jgi:hypothetical protein